MTIKKHKNNRPKAETVQIMLENDARVYPHIGALFQQGLFGEVLPTRPVYYCPSQNRRAMNIDGQAYMYARLVYLLHHGLLTVDKPYVDHIDGNTLNDHPDNLRAVSHMENMRNRPRSQGASLNGSNYRATLQSCGRNIHIGQFPTAALAHQAYLAAKKHYHPELYAHIRALPLEHVLQYTTKALRAKKKAKK